MDEILTAISTVGYPIVLTLILLWYIYDSNTKHKEETDLITQRHKQEMDIISEALNNNTIALTKLGDRIGGNEHA